MMFRGLANCYDRAMESDRTNLQQLSSTSSTAWLVGLSCAVAAGVWLLAGWFGFTDAVGRPIAPGLVTLQEGWADESQCIDCHDQATDFWETGHARTLARADTVDSVKLLEALSSSEIGQREQVAVVADSSELRLLRDNNGVSSTARVDWCFGSGEHARTWVSTLPDALGSQDLLEFRWTWYHETGDFDVTPGQPDASSAGTIGSLGLLFDGPRAWRCFSCHSSRLPTADQPLDENHIHAGVTCQRCHGPRQQHVESEGSFHHPGWAIKDRDTAVDRCAECHRRAEEMAADSIWPGNRDIVRFQPVGLVQSACYTKSQMSCTTCHDPHRPMARPESRDLQQCIQCHDPGHNDHVVCAADMTDNCLECHMPPVESRPGLSFTDHWIRIRDDSEQQP